MQNMYVSRLNLLHTNLEKLTTSTALSSSYNTLSIEIKVLYVYKNLLL